MNWFKRFEFGMFWVLVLALCLWFWVWVWGSISNLIEHRNHPITLQEYEVGLVKQFGQKHVDDIHKRTLKSVSEGE